MRSSNGERRLSGPADRFNVRTAVPSSDGTMGQGSDPDPRFLFANDRTFLAWSRTGLALISGGIAVSQFVHFGFGGARLLVALPLIALGALMSIRSYPLWRRNERALRNGQSLSSSNLPWILVGGASVVAAIATILILLQVAIG
jgi:putative membrane protein